ncbi:MAG: histidinol-phosphate transaminase [Candidatus Bathyarchaeia archaeon]|jgi:threonine-phosphate decarboxylase
MAGQCKERRFISHGGDIWGFSRKYKVPLEEVLEFSGPINFLGPSPKAVEAVREQAKLIKFYPDPNPVEFKAAIAKYVGHGVGEENVVLGDGSIELIYAITQILPRGFKALIPIPSFSEYEKAAMRVGSEVIFLQLPENFSMDNEKIKRAITPETKILCICNPHSPSGTLYSKESVLDLVDYCHKKDVIFSIDENYIEFAEKGQETTLAGMVKQYDNLFVIRSVTKFYGMAGIRLGYGLASPDMVEKLENVRLPWSINSLASCATLAAFGDTEFIENTKKTIAKEREVLARSLGGIEGLHVYPSVTNFLLVKITNGKITSTKLKEALVKERMLIRDCCTFMGLDDKYFRVTVRSAKDNQKLVQAIKRAF